MKPTVTGPGTPAPGTQAPPRSVSPRPIRTIADLPFAEAAPDALLGIDWGRPASVDDDHIGYGWGLVPRLMLLDASGVVARLSAPLVLALHSATREPGSTAPFDLELVVNDERLHIPLERFLAVWLPQLPEASDVVLALCNPTDYPLTRPVLAPHTRCWVACGDVDSSAHQPADGPTTWHLTARRWTRL